MADTPLKIDPNGRNIMGAVDDSTGDIVPLYVANATGRLKVDAAVSITGLPTAVSDGDAVNAANDGTIILGTDGSNYQVLSTDSSGRILLGAGTLAIGKLAANSGVDIGDVDITSIAAGDNNIGNVDIVTVPTDPFGADADAASATGSISAKLRRLATDLNAVVSGSEIQADIVGALPSGTNAIGKLAANSGVDIGDVDVTSLPAYTTPASGELAGSASATQMPSVACKLAKFKAAYDNAGRVYIGGSGVTKKDGTTDTTTGIELSAGEETGWLPVSNINVFYRICDNAGDDLTYLTLA